MSHLLKPKSFEMQSGPGKHLDEKFNSYSLGSQSSRKFVPTLQLPDILAKIQRKLPPEEVDKLIDEVRGRDGNDVKSVLRKRETKSWAFASQSRTEYYAAIKYAMYPKTLRDKMRFYWLLIPSYFRYLDYHESH